MAAASGKSEDQVHGWQDAAIPQQQGGVRHQLLCIPIGGAAGDLHIDGQGGQDGPGGEAAVPVGSRQGLRDCGRLEGEDSGVVCHRCVHTVHP